jgi:hypothetical protein
LFNTVVSPFAIASTDNLTLFSLFISTKSTTESEQLHRASWRKENHENWLDAFFFPVFCSCKGAIPLEKLQSLCSERQTAKSFHENKFLYISFKNSSIQTSQSGNGSGQVEQRKAHLAHEIRNRNPSSTTVAMDTKCTDADRYTHRARKSWAGCSSDHCCVQYAYIVAFQRTVVNNWSRACPNSQAAPLMQHSGFGELSVMALQPL